MSLDMESLRDSVRAALKEKGVWSKLQVRGCLGNRAPILFFFPTQATNPFLPLPLFFN